jgi:hypothetical protein
LGVSDDDELLPAKQRADGIFGPHLRGLVDDEQVEIEGPGRIYCAAEVGDIIQMGFRAWRAPPARWTMSRIGVLGLLSASSLSSRPCRSSDPSDVALPPGADRQAMGEMARFELVSSSSIRLNSLRAFCERQTAKAAELAPSPPK